ncbi:MAG TPA: biopolymer transporter ExbD [Pirellulales bacterium]|nr:biopolymer transporter ExbD [Pirellulales bacterium]
MRVKARNIGEAAEADLTPMIDMTFQLIAFFMVLVNFTQAEQDARVDLPASKLAKPPEQVQEQPLTIQLAKIKGSNPAEFIALIGGDEIPVGKELEGILVRERRAFGRMGRPAAGVIVIIRAHKDVDTGKVQEVIEMCQKEGFERFRLRAKEEN